MTSHFSPLAVLLIRWTALLALAWTIHAHIRNRHPRWRLILWRAVLCFTLLMPFARLTLFKLPVPPALTHVDRPVAQPIPAPQISSELPTQSPASSPFVSLSVQPIPSNLPLRPTGPTTISAPPTSVHRRVSWRELALSVWALGALWAVGRLLRFHVILHRLRAQSQPAPEALQNRAREIAAALKVSRPFAVCVSAATASPFAGGLFKPVVLLPKTLLDTLPDEEVTVLMAHEIAHFRRGDLFWCVAWRWLQALSWPHPLIWAIPAAHNLACEEEADRLASTSLKDRAQYSPLLARLALRILELPPLETHLVLNAASHIARRLDQLKRGSSRFWGWKQATAGYALAGALFVATAACGFSSGDASATDAPNVADEPGTKFLVQASNQLALIAADPALVIEKARIQASNQMARGYFIRGSSRAVSGRFQDAAPDFEQGIKLDPSDDLMWLWFTSLLIHNQEADKYRAACKEMLRRFSDTTDGQAAQIVSQTALWIPGAIDPQDFDLAVKLANKSVALTEEGDFEPWRRMAKGLSAYRQGQFKGAADILDPLMKEMDDHEQAGTKTPSFDTCQPDVCFISAMAHRQLNEPDQARAAINQGHDIVNERLPALDSQDLGGDWMNVLTTHALMSEADKTVGIAFQPQPRVSIAATDNKEMPLAGGPLAPADPAKMPPSHQLRGANGLRVWQRIDDQTWHEVFPFGPPSVFKVAGRAKIGQIEGTVITKVAGDPRRGTPNDGTFQAFIPDQGSASAHHWFRFSPDGEWHENPAEFEAFQPGASDKPADNAVAPLTAADLSKMPHSYRFGDGNGLRVWQRIDDHTWHEVYPDGFTSVFKVVGRAKVAGGEGTVVAKIAGDVGRTGTPNDGTLQAFIPDKDSPIMHHRFRFSPAGQWRDLAQMEDVQ